MQLPTMLLCVIIKKYPGSVLLDPEDYEKFKFIGVHKTSKGYIQFKLKGKTVSLHQAVTNFEHKILDHKNNKPWDCRKENLRPATVSQNQHNQPLRTNNTSGYKGVGFLISTNRWYARITLNGKKYQLGTYPTKELAYEAYKKKAEELFGDYAHFG